jgi:1,4-alpha-glucan branching enzyme
LPPWAFVSFLQTHDQVGNRALGERIAQLAGPEALRAAVAIVLLAPFPPLLFMGEEWAAAQPFLFFCDFSGELRAAVTAGRRREFARFAKFGGGLAAEDAIPDPNNPDTYTRSILDWTALERAPHRDFWALYRHLLALRRREIVPRGRGMRLSDAAFEVHGSHGVLVRWLLGDGSRLVLVANMGDAAYTYPSRPRGSVLYATHTELLNQSVNLETPPWAVAYFLDRT